MTDGTENDSSNPEVPEKAKRRRFEASYKLRILEEADLCTERGQLGKLLRREGLYATHLATWRKQRAKGVLNALEPKKRGRKPKRKDSAAADNEQLRRENERLTERLRQAEKIIEVQKKVSEILGIPLQTPSDDEKS